MNNNLRRQFCSFTGLLCLFSIVHFSVMLSAKAISSEIAISAIIISLFTYLLAGRYIKYYVLHTCLGCRKDLESGERYLLIVENKASSLARCRDCYSRLPPTVKEFYRREEFDEKNLQ